MISVILVDLELEQMEKALAHFKTILEEQGIGFCSRIWNED